MAGTDGDALVLGERHSLLCVDNQPYPGHVPAEFGVLILVDIQDHLQPCVDQSDSLSEILIRRTENNNHYVRFVLAVHLLSLAFMA